jgi:integrase
VLSGSNNGKNDSAVDRWAVEIGGGDGAGFYELDFIFDSERLLERRIVAYTAGVQGVTLHCYRYAWAERAKVAGMPERFAQAALGHNSNAIHRAYAKHAQIIVPSLEDYKKRAVIKMEATI